MTNEDRETSRPHYDPQVSYRYDRHEGEYSAHTIMIALSDLKASVNTLERVVGHRVDIVDSRVDVISRDLQREVKQATSAHAKFEESMREMREDLYSLIRWRERTVGFLAAVGMVSGLVSSLIVLLISNLIGTR